MDKALFLTFHKNLDRMIPNLYQTESCLISVIIFIIMYYMFLISFLKWNGIVFSIDKMEAEHVSCF